MAMFKNVTSWFYALLETVIGGAATSAIASAVLPNTITDWEDRWKVALSAMLTNLFFYLRKSPLPPRGDDTDIVTKENV